VINNLPASTANNLGWRYHITTESVDHLLRNAMATILTVVAVAILVVTSLVNSNEQAPVQSDNRMARLHSPPATPLSAPIDTAQAAPFTFGYLVFERDPALGVAGFAALPSQPRHDDLD
jgi:hypothetical protein